MKGLKGPTTSQGRVRAWTFVISLLILAALTVFGFVEPTKTWFDEYDVPTNLAMTALLIAAGGAAFFVDSAERQRRLDEAITSAGFAAVVDQLSDVDRALTLWLRSPELLKRARRQAKKPQESKSESPFKWAKILRNEEYESEILGLTKEQLENLVKPRTEGQPLDDAQPEPAARHRRWVERRIRYRRAKRDGVDDLDDLKFVAHVSDEALRRLMGALRGWADLLSRTTSGIEAMDAVNSLRKGLMLTRTHADGGSDVTRRGEAAVSPNVALSRIVWECAARARFLSLVFERAADSPGLRPHQLKAHFPIQTQSWPPKGWSQEAGVWQSPASDWPTELTTPSEARALLTQFYDSDQNWPEVWMKGR